MKGKAKHSLQDLNEYLFDELDALTNGDLQGEQLNAEIERSKAVVQVAGRIANNAAIQIKAAQLMIDNGTPSAQKTEETVIGLLSSEE
jgi:hypothetical protein